MMLRKDYDVLRKMMMLKNKTKLFSFFFYEGEISSQICRATRSFDTLRPQQSGVYSESRNKPQQSSAYSDGWVKTTRLLFRRECLCRTHSLTPKTFIYMYIQPLC